MKQTTEGSIQVNFSNHSVILSKMVQFSIRTVSAGKSLQTVIKTLNTYDGSPIMIKQESEKQKLSECTKLYNFSIQLWREEGKEMRREAYQKQSQKFEMISNFLTNQLNIVIEKNNVSDLRTECKNILTKYKQILFQT